MILKRLLTANAVAADSMMKIFLSSIIRNGDGTIQLSIDVLEIISHEVLFDTLVAEAFPEVA